MSTSTSHRRGSSGHQRGAHHGGGSGGGGDEGGGGGGGGGGDLVKVAFARNLPEAEMLQGLLAEAGIPSVLKRTPPYDIPHMHVVGPHDVYVSREVAPRATEVLAETMVESEDEERLELEEERRLARGESGGPDPGRLAFWILAVAVGGFLLLWLLYELT